MYSSMWGFVCLRTLPAHGSHKTKTTVFFLSEMVLFKYKYVYKVTSNDSSFLANKILNTLFKNKNKTKGKWQLVVSK